MPTPRSATAAARAAATAPPMVVVQTEKSKALRTLGRWKRSGRADLVKRFDRAEAPLQPPKAPAEVYKTKFKEGPKSVACFASISKQAQLKGGESDGKSLWFMSPAEEQTRRKEMKLAGLADHSSMIDSRGFAKYTMRPWLSSAPELPDSHNTPPGRQPFVSGRVRQLP